MASCPNCSSRAEEVPPLTWAHPSLHVEECTVESYMEFHIITVYGEYLIPQGHGNCELCIDPVRLEVTVLRSLHCLHECLITLRAS